MAQMNDRIARVNELLKREIADVIEKYSLNEGGLLVSITKVHASESLRNATVYVSIFGADDQKSEEVIKKLYKLKPEIQRQVARHVILKYTPVLQFVRDTNLEEGDRVLALIRELEEQ
jgi:ribosome-binding factor A